LKGRFFVVHACAREERKVFLVETEKKQAMNLVGGFIFRQEEEGKRAKQSLMNQSAASRGERKGNGRGEWEGRKGREEW